MHTKKLIKITLCTLILFVFLICQNNYAKAQHSEQQTEKEKSFGFKSLPGNIKKYDNNHQTNIILPSKKLSGYIK